MPKILIIEDEEITAIALSTLLETLGYEILDNVNNAKEALEVLEKTQADLIISDIMIKGNISGCELAKQISIKYKDIPIILLTAYCDDEMIQYALEANVFGYIIKPYKESEIKAMVNIALNKKNPIKRNSKIDFDDYTFDQDTNKLYKKEKEMKVGKKTLVLLKILLKNKNNMTSFETLINEIWEYYDKKSIDNLRQLVKRTKEKLDITCIESVKNIGYKINTD